MPSIETQESMLHRVEQVQLVLYVHPVLGKRENKCFFKQQSSTSLTKAKELALVVRKVDNAIHRITHYPVDSVVGFVNTYPLDSDLSGE